MFLSDFARAFWSDITGKPCTCRECRAEAGIRALRDQQAREAAEDSLRASEKAQALLLKHLTPSQREHYVRTTEVPVTTKSGRHFLVKRQHTHSTDELNRPGGRKIANWCA